MVVRDGVEPSWVEHHLIYSQALSRTGLPNILAPGTGCEPVTELLTAICTTNCATRDYSNKVLIVNQYCLVLKTSVI